MTFTPDHSDKTFACPRTWEFASRLLKQSETVSQKHLPLLAGTLSEGVAQEVIAFCQIFKQLPTKEDIMRNPRGIDVPTDPGTLYAISGAIGTFMDVDNADTLMQFVSRLPLEFQVVTLSDLIRRDKAMFSHPAINQWVQTNRSELWS